MSILDNGIGSIRVGVEDLKSDDSARIISGLRSIHAGVLLLIKAKLSQLSPPNSDEVLIKQKIKPTLSDAGIVFVGDGSKTVDVYEMQERTKALGIPIDWPLIREIGKIRNDAEHYYTSLSPDAIRAALAKSFVVIRDVLESHFKIKPLDALGPDVWELLLSNADVYDKERIACLKALHAIDWDSPALEEAVESACCMKCGSDLMYPHEKSKYLEDLKLRCSSCGEIMLFGEFATKALREHYAASEHVSVKDGGDPEIIDCPHCGEYGYVIAEEKCSLCGENATQECSRCGCNIPASEISDGDLCGYCQHMFDKDD